MSEYSYSFSDFTTSGGAISQTRLMHTIGQTPSLSSKIYGLAVLDVEEECIFYSSVELTAPEIADLDAIVGAHTGAPWYSYIPILGTFSHAEEHDILASWGDITGGVADLSAFGYPVADLVAMTKCELLTDGAGAELDMYEKGGSSLMSASYACPDTGGVWQKIAFYTNLPISAGDRTYVCRGQKNAVATAKIRFMTLAVSSRLSHP